VVAIRFGAMLVVNEVDRIYGMVTDWNIRMAEDLLTAAAVSTAMTKPYSRARLKMMFMRIRS